jgi:phosphate starvation-inducible PhoH-like protein
MTEAQGHYILSMQSKQLTFSDGPAGTGKTFCCTIFGAELLASGKIKKLIVTRPAVEAGQGLGFLPGTIEEKFAPYFAPFKHILESYFGASHLEYLIKRGIIEIAPLEYIRGLTFDDCFVILDEAQNTTPKQMKLFLTRLGKYGHAVVNGDADQQDIEGESGLQDAINRFTNMPQIGIVQFDEDDVVRSGLVKEILKRYRKS